MQKKWLKIQKCFFIIMVNMILLIPNKVFADTSSEGGYYIKSYDIKMIVNEDNTFDITETITAYFTSLRHGIFRKIPLQNVVERTDGTKSSNRAIISNIKVSENFSEYNEGKYKVIKIGNANKSVIGEHTYIIKYRYNIGKDPLKNMDELYYNLIGPEWDANISDITFNVTMPKSFDKSKLGISAGTKYAKNNVEYTVDGNVISGRVNGTLSTYPAVTIRLELPEGYFVGASNNFDTTMLIGIVVSIIFVSIAYILWKKYGKDDQVIETVEFYPPDGLNSAELGFMYKGYSEDKDIVSLLIYLANEGYIKIIEEQKKSFKIIKVKDYDGNNPNETIFMDNLFKDGNEVTESSLQNHFYMTVNTIKRNIDKKQNQEKVFESTSLGKRSIIVIMIVIVFVLMGGLSIFKIGDGEIIAIVVALLAVPLIKVYSKPEKGITILTMLAFGVVTLLCMVDKIEMDKIYLVQYVLEGACECLLIVFLGIMKKRTAYGTEMLGKIKGFKNFLEVAEKDQLEVLVMKNPEYFYNILPYTYVLDVSSKWISKFESIAMEPPTWFTGYDGYDMIVFNRFMNNSYSQIANSMVSKPSSSSIGSSSGGGFSGGGSGGGRWRILVKTIKIRR